MFQKKSVGLALALCAGLSVPAYSVKSQSKKQKSTIKRVFKTLGTGLLSLGAAAGSGYGLYWANNYNLKKTVKPLLTMTFLGSFLTAGYICVGQFILKNMVKSAKEKIKDYKKELTDDINKLGEKLKSIVNEAKENMFPRIVLPSVRRDPKGQNIWAVFILYFFDRKTLIPSLIKKNKLINKRLIGNKKKNSLLSSDQVQLIAIEKIKIPSINAIASWRILFFASIFFSIEYFLIFFIFLSVMCSLI